MFFIDFMGRMETFDSFESFARRLIWIKGHRAFRYTRKSFGFYNRFTGVGNWVAHI